MTSDSATAAATPSVPAAAQEEPPSKIDPITAVQDSIDSLALSLFEALRGVRDAVAPESLEVPGARTATTSSTTATSAFQEATDEIEKDATANERLLHGLNTDYFPPRAFDLLEPDYESFLMAYLSDNPYAKDLVERFAALESKAGDTKETTENSDMVELGDVGYEFRKKFDPGWYTGKVKEIRPLAGA
mmetsp:Transcript_32961/g.57676  ORF Transcript_32961/g.57676 Transcript_32961/m.57676 type:complete len:189 (+) Transcript_32961:44-610(+)